MSSVNRMFSGGRCGSSILLCSSGILLLYSKEIFLPPLFPILLAEFCGILHVQWREQADEPMSVPRTLNGEDLPETVDEVPDDVLSWAVRCKESKRPFRIIKQEL